MTQALIQINAVSGPNADLPINVLVQLNNLGTGGEVSWLWTILNQPPGAADALSNVAIQNPTFTPKKEGTYLLQVIVNQALPSEQRDQTIAAILQLKTRQRVPAAGESDEAGATGWAELALNPLLRTLDARQADPGVVVGTLLSNCAVNQIHRPNGITQLMAGLPGQQDITQWGLTGGADADIVNMPIACAIAAVDGGALTIGKLAYFRVFGLIQNVPIVGAILNDVVYASDIKQLDRVTGTNTRKCGRIIRVPAVDTADVYFHGLGGS